KAPPDNPQLHQRWKERTGMFTEYEEMDSYALAALMTDLSLVDGMLSAADRIYRETVPSVLRFVGKRSRTRRVIGMHIMVLKNRLLFFADTTLNVNPDAEVLADCGRLCAEAVQALGITPRVAFISYNNFGAANQPESEKARVACELF